MMARMLTIFWGSIGLFISLLFAWATNAKPPQNDSISFVWRIFPTLCNMETGTCGSLLQSKQARLLGIPNYLLGILFYLFSLSVAIFTSMAPGMLYWSLVLVTTGTVFIGAFLIFSLIFTLRTNCLLCYMAHAVNFLLLATLILNGILQE